MAIVAADSAGARLTEAEAELERICDRLLAADAAAESPLSQAVPAPAPVPVGPNDTQEVLAALEGGAPPAPPPDWQEAAETSQHAGLSGLLAAAEFHAKDPSELHQQHRELRDVQRLLRGLASPTRSPGGTRGRRSPSPRRAELAERILRLHAPSLAGSRSPSPPPPPTAVGGGKLRRSAPASWWGPAPGAPDDAAEAAARAAARREREDALARAAGLLHCSLLSQKGAAPPPPPQPLRPPPRGGPLVILQQQPVAPVPGPAAAAAAAAAPAAAAPAPAESVAVAAARADAAEAEAVCAALRRELAAKQMTAEQGARAGAARERHEAEMRLQALRDELREGEAAAQRERDAARRQLEEEASRLRDAAAAAARREEAARRALDDVERRAQQAEEAARDERRRREDTERRALQGAPADAAAAATQQPQGQRPGAAASPPAASAPAAAAAAPAAAAAAPAAQPAPPPAAAPTALEDALREADVRRRLAEEEAAALRRRADGAQGELQAELAALRTERQAARDEAARWQKAAQEAAGRAAPRPGHRRSVGVAAAPQQLRDVAVDTVARAARDVLGGVRTPAPYCLVQDLTAPGPTGAAGPAAPAPAPQPQPQGPRFLKGDRVRVRLSEKDPWQHGEVVGMLFGRPLVRADGEEAATAAWSDVLHPDEEPGAPREVVVSKPPDGLPPGVPPDFADVLEASGRAPPPVTSDAGFRPFAPGGTEAVAARLAAEAERKLRGVAEEKGGLHGAAATAVKAEAEAGVLDEVMGAVARRCMRELIRRAAQDADDEAQKRNTLRHIPKSAVHKFHPGMMVRVRDDPTESWQPGRVACLMVGGQPCVEVEGKDGSPVTRLFAQVVPAAAAAAAEPAPAAAARDPDAVRRLAADLLRDSVLRMAPQGAELRSRGALVAAAEAATAAAVAVSIACSRRPVPHLVLLAAAGVAVLTAAAAAAAKRPAPPGAGIEVTVTPSPAPQHPAVAVTVAGPAAAGPELPPQLAAAAAAGLVAAVVATPLRPPERPAAAVGAAAAGGGAPAAQVTITIRDDRTRAAPEGPAAGGLEDLLSQGRAVPLGVVGGRLVALPQREAPAAAAQTQAADTAPRPLVTAPVLPDAGGAGIPLSALEAGSRVHARRCAGKPWRLGTVLVCRAGVIYVRCDGDDLANGYDPSDVAPFDPSQEATLQGSAASYSDVESVVERALAAREARLERLRAASRMLGKEETAERGELAIEAIELHEFAFRLLAQGAAFSGIRQMRWGAFFDWEASRRRTLYRQATEALPATIAKMIAFPSLASAMLARYGPEEARVRMEDLPRTRDADAARARGEDVPRARAEDMRLYDTPRLVVEDAIRLRSGDEIRVRAEDTAQRVVATEAQRVEIREEDKPAPPAPRADGGGAVAAERSPEAPREERTRQEAERAARQDFIRIRGEDATRARADDPIRGQGAAPERARAEDATRARRQDAPRARAEDAPAARARPEDQPRARIEDARRVRQEGAERMRAPERAPVAPEAVRVRSDAAAPADREEAARIRRTDGAVGPEASRAPVAEAQRSREPAPAPAAADAAAPAAEAGPAAPPPQSAVDRAAAGAARHGRADARTAALIMQWFETLDQPLGPAAAPPAKRAPAAPAAQRPAAATQEGRARPSAPPAAGPQARRPAQPPAAAAPPPAQGVPQPKQSAQPKQPDADESIISLARRASRAEDADTSYSTSYPDSSTSDSVLSPAKGLLYGGALGGARFDRRNWADLLQLRLLPAVLPARDISTSYSSSSITSSG